MPNNTLTILKNLINFTSDSQQDPAIKASVFYFEFFGDLKNSSDCSDANLIEFYYRFIRQLTITDFLKNQLKQSNIEYALTSNSYSHTGLDKGSVPRDKVTDPYDAGRYYYLLTYKPYCSNPMYFEVDTRNSSPIAYMLEEFKNLSLSQINQQVVELFTLLFTAIKSPETKHDKDIQELIELFKKTFLGANTSAGISEDLKLVFAAAFDRIGRQDLAMQIYILINDSERCSSLIKSLASQAISEIKDFTRSTQTALLYSEDQFCQKDLIGAFNGLKNNNEKTIAGFLLLAKFYNEGSGTLQNRQLAIQMLYDGFLVYNDQRLLDKLIEHHKNHSDNVNICYYIAKCYLEGKDKKYDEARKYLDLVNANNAKLTVKEWSEVEKEMAGLYFKSAEAERNNAEKEPDDAKKDQDFQLSITAYKHAKEFNHPDADHQIGLTYQQWGDFKLQKKEFDKAIEMFEKAKEYDRADTALLDKRMHQTRKQKALALLEQSDNDYSKKQPEESDEKLEQVMKLGLYTARAYLRQADRYINTIGFLRSTAIEKYQQALTTAIKKNDTLVIVELLHTRHDDTITGTLQSTLGKFIGDNFQAIQAIIKVLSQDHKLKDKDSLIEHLFKTAEFRQEIIANLPLFKLSNDCHCRLLETYKDSPEFDDLALAVLKTVTLDQNGKFIVELITKLGKARESLGDDLRSELQFFEKDFQTLALSDEIQHPKGLLQKIYNSQVTKLEQLGDQCPLAIVLYIQYLQTSKKSGIADQKQRLQQQLLSNEDFITHYFYLALNGDTYAQKLFSLLKDLPEPDKKEQEQEHNPKKLKTKIYCYLALITQAQAERQDIIQRGLNYDSAFASTLMFQLEYVISHFVDHKTVKECAKILLELYNKSTKPESVMSTDTLNYFQGLLNPKDTVSAGIHSASSSSSSSSSFSNSAGSTLYPNFSSEENTILSAPSPTEEFAPSAPPPEENFAPSAPTIADDTSSASTEKEKTQQRIGKLEQLARIQRQLTDSLKAENTAQQQKIEKLEALVAAQQHQIKELEQENKQLKSEHGPNTEFSFFTSQPSNNKQSVPTTTTPSSTPTT